MKVRDFLKKVGYEERVLEELKKCESREEKREVLVEWLNDLDRGFELGEEEEFDKEVENYLLE